ncbi:PPR domain-containing protein/PPR_3 domain-containing protein [Cephalotus follicularis]|uniref:PPR domain-containing protein/PPR_3 domain-containing protein n=1 Tax=Cephalotus follicularis TaxID=3775 RepID=A0A1Q3B5N6_CEPFO|nr:PPR domain-containing protein/PPR_3 domain-containing protein [Cephalotus follicularis]
MGTYSCNILSSSHPKYPLIIKTTKPSCGGTLLFQNPLKPGAHKFSVFAVIKVEERQETHKKEEQEIPKFKWLEVGPNNLTQAQRNAISELPPKMMNRCKAFLRQIICYSPEKGSLSDLLVTWVRIMKPRRADWLAVLKQLNIMEHPLYLQVAELALLEEFFEATIRDYTKIIHHYGKQNRLQDAENTLLAMEKRGIVCDQVTLTAMVDMYSKGGNLKLAEETFKDIELLGQPLDKRSYGAMIMAYIRAGMLDHGETLLREMDAKEIKGGSEVYKAMLRAYSMIGDTGGAQRVFDAIQFAGICPDVKLCRLLINAYRMAGQSHKARIAFENMRKAGLEPDDKCVALVLAAYEKESKLNVALDFLIRLERDGIIVGKEASEVLAGWFKRLGVVEEVELVLREYTAR